MDMSDDETKSQYQQLQNEFDITCQTFNENVDRLCKTIEKVDRHKTIQTVSFLAFGVVVVIAFTMIILLPIG